MITFAIITCNRLHYAKNCLESVLEFVDLDDVNLLVIDNNTVEEGASDFLNSLPDFVDVKQYTDRRPHELHRAMNYAIEYARKKGDQYVNFLQDDYQFLYKKKNVVELISSTFEKSPEVVQLQLNMPWKKKIHKSGRIKFVDVNGSPWIYLFSKPSCDNGFTRVKLYDKIGLYPDDTSIHGREKNFTSGEGWISRRCKKGPYKRMMSAEPNMGMIIDCAYIRGNKRHGPYFKPPHKYYLKPFSLEKIELVKKKSEEHKWCFIEEMVEPDGWSPQAMQKHGNPRVETSV